VKGRRLQSSIRRWMRREKSHKPTGSRNGGGGSKSDGLFVFKFDWDNRKNPRRQQREKRYQKKKGANQDNKRHEVSCMQKCSPASHTWYGLSFVGSGFS